ncbi:MAG TPA: VOC family protein [Candidatus Rubrimentiphilum sp.]|nr:VOC family protein [Candidatus Rubrimentiphilum sp.]
MAVKEIAFVAYPAKDVPGLAKFYEDVVGLKLDQTMGEGPEMKFAQFTLPNNGWFSVITLEWADVPPGSGYGVAFEVDDIEATLKSLRGKALDVDDKPYDTPVCRLAQFKDPEGNRVSLHQITVPH